MEDLIPRMAAIEICKSIVPNTNPDFYNLRSKKGYGCWMHSNGEAVASTSIQVRIKELPAVDAAPVVHGRWSEKRWITEDDWGVINHRAIVCSACKREIADGERTCYCPNCGAKMDKEK